MLSKLNKFLIITNPSRSKFSSAQVTKIKHCMVFAPAPLSPPPPPPLQIIMGGLNLKICQNFLGQDFFLNLRGNKPLWGELKLYGGVIFITTRSLFYFFRNSQTPRKTKSFKNFFRKYECISRGRDTGWARGAMAPPIICKLMIFFINKNG